MPCVYVIAWSTRGPTKVGKASDITSRLASLQTACPYRLRVWAGISVPTDDQAHLLEAEAHDTLAPDAMIGEWFRLPPSHAKAALITIARRSYHGWELWRPSKEEREARANILNRTKKALSDQRNIMALQEARELHAELGGRRWS